MPTSNRVLVTGGAGFIGSHVSDELLQNGYDVRVFDSLDPQVHPGAPKDPPSYLSREVEFVYGDVRDSEALERALTGVDAVIHLAAAVGVGQSMYQIAHYAGVNDLGTAVLLEALTAHDVEKLVVASSMSVYGEGAYQSATDEPACVAARSRAQLERSQWEHYNEHAVPLIPVPTSEQKTPHSTSIYALSKYVQERMCLIWGEAYQVPTTALRFFNAYGPRQSLANPYTGVLAIFSSRLLNGERPLIYEDGEQRRDFVNVHDVARACRLALESPKSHGHAINVASGRPVTIRAVAEELAAVLNCPHIEPEIVGRYRVGDIRHCFADISKATDLLGYEPQVKFRDGLEELSEWLSVQEKVSSQVSQAANNELLGRGLMV